MFEQSNQEYMIKKVLQKRNACQKKYVQNI
uniref:Uncharacterized protein n=1 Tax=Musa acuminata subsp. malaccensis TaxID=214687 RepID=A0A804I7H0_MUSAM